MQDTQRNFVSHIWIKTTSTQEFVNLQKEAKQHWPVLLLYLFLPCIASTPNLNYKACCLQWIKNRTYKYIKCLGLRTDYLFSMAIYIDYLWKTLVVTVHLIIY
jgi:hypothetical protein